MKANTAPAADVLWTPDKKKTAHFVHSLCLSHNDPSSFTLWACLPFNPLLSPPNLRTSPGPFCPTEPPQKSCCWVWAHVVQGQIELNALVGSLKRRSCCTGKQGTCEFMFLSNPSYLKVLISSLFHSTRTQQMPFVYSDTTKWYL